MAEARLAVNAPELAGEKRAVATQHLWQSALGQQALEDSDQLFGPSLSAAAATLG
jgi:hypothetical protein